MNSQPPLHSYEGSDLDELAELSNYQDWIMETISPYLSGRCIEFGAGRGAMSALLVSHVEQLELVEPSANLFASLKERFADEAKVIVVGQRLEDHIFSLVDETYDCVVLINVLEHIQDDADALKKIVRILKPGGHLILFVPALQVLYSKLDEIVGHFRRYHRARMVELARDAGFRVLAAKYFDLLGAFPWWVINKLGGKTHFSPAAVKFYDRCGVPLTKALEGVINPPFGKNIILIALKP